MVDAFMRDMFADMWDDFTECEYRLIEDVDVFLESAEVLGLAEFIPVDDDALRDPFASERGLEKGGIMWSLTKAGQTRYHAARFPTHPCTLKAKEATDGE